VRPAPLRGPLTALLAALQSGAASAAELVDDAVARIERLDPPLNAVVVRDVDRARAAARLADEARARGETRPLLGVPLTVKEAIDVAGLPTTWGQPGASTPAAHDAVLVARLKAAGAIVLGKTNVATMLADWQTANPVYGVTSNPWDRTRTPGGSSGGAAAALAAGMTPLEFGSDLAGSLRIPASFCGVCAHRPSAGLVPTRGFAPPGAPRDDIAPPVDQAVLGPMARSAADLALALDVIAGPDADDAVAWRLQLPPPRATALRDFRVLVVDTHPLVPTAASIRGALDGLADELARAGCTVGRSDPELPDFREVTTLFTTLLSAFMGVDAPEGGPSTSHRDWVQADRRRYALAARWRRLFARWDVVLTPTAPTTAFPHDARPFDQRTLDVDGQAVPYRLLPLWTALPTPTGHPATTMPIGRDANGLPIGVQVIGPRLEDRTPIAFAGMVEALRGEFGSPPV
jgi:amidase